MSEVKERNREALDGFMLNTSVTSNGCVARRGEDYWWFAVANSAVYNWENLYPHIKVLYTPSGELVTGFEYAGKETL